MSAIVPLLLVCAVLAAVYVLAQCAVEWLFQRRTMSYGDTATRRPSCRCGKYPATDDHILAFTDGWGRHTSQRCTPWEGAA